MDRLVPSPEFVLCPIRSGSTLLRCILNSHTQVCAPHELHVADLEVRENGRYVRLTMDTAGLRKSDLEHLLWDRVLHRHLQSTGKEVIVDKTPGNLLLWQRLRDCWPAARFVFLRRHPAPGPGVRALGSQPGAVRAPLFDHGPFVFGIGDFGADIRSGQVIRESADIDPDDVPVVARAAARRWGYLAA